MCWGLYKDSEHGPLQNFSHSVCGGEQTISSNYHLVVKDSLKLSFSVLLSLFQLPWKCSLHWTRLLKTSL